MKKQLLFLFFALPWLTLQAQVSCGSTFTDNGGPDANYTNGANIVTTICPENPGDVVTVTFSSFATEAMSDGLYVFNGNSEFSPQLSSGNPAGFVPGGMPGAFWGSQLPGPFTSTSPDGCLTFKFRSDGTGTATGWLANVSCALGTQDNIELLAFLDTNENGIRDAAEPDFNLGYFTVNRNNEGEVTYASSNGRLIISDQEIGNSYDFGFVIDPVFDANFSSSQAFENIAAGNGTQQLLFPVVITEDLNDVSIALIPAGAPRAGAPYFNEIVYRNNGTDVTSGTIEFSKAAEVTFFSGLTPVGATLTPTGFSYPFSELQPFETRRLMVQLQVPPIPTVNLDDLLTNSAVITSVIPDERPFNNNATLTQMVVASYDPNDITEARGPKIDIDTFTDQDYLYYTIRFQNTGTANAETVRITNALPSQIDAVTLEMVASSHDYIFTANGSELSWEFQNIDLPFQSQDEAASNGYVSYKVRLNPGFQVGDTVTGIAEIYFDTNPAIITEAFVTEFVNDLETPDHTIGKIRMYPNPAKNSVVIQLESDGKLAAIKISDVLGKKIYDSKTSLTNHATIDISGISNGIYLVEITTENNQRILKKLLVE